MSFICFASGPAVAMALNNNEMSREEKIGEGEKTRTTMTSVSWYSRRMGRSTHR